MNGKHDGGGGDRYAGRPRAWMSADGLISSVPGGGYDVPLVPMLEAEAIRRELDRLRAENDRYTRERMDLALLVARLVRRLRDAREGKGCLAGDDAMANAALEYLQRKGLSSPLRNEQPNAEAIGPDDAGKTHE